MGAINRSSNRKNPQEDREEGGGRKEVLSHVQGISLNVPRTCNLILFLESHLC